MEKTLKDKKLYMRDYIKCRIEREPDYLEKRRQRWYELNKLRREDPEYRRKISIQTYAINKKRLQDPVYREKINAMAREYYRKKKINV